jgi:hypothetical protein
MQSYSKLGMQFGAVRAPGWQIIGLFFLTVFRQT